MPLDLRSIENIIKRELLARGCSAPLPAKAVLSSRRDFFLFKDSTNYDFINQTQVSTKNPSPFLHEEGFFLNQPTIKLFRSYS